MLYLWRCDIGAWRNGRKLEIRWRTVQGQQCEKNGDNLKPVPCWLALVNLYFTFPTSLLSLKEVFLQKEPLVKLLNQDLEIGSSFPWAALVLQLVLFKLHVLWSSLCSFSHALCFLTKWSILYNFLSEDFEKKGQWDCYWVTDMITC